MWDEQKRQRLERLREREDAATLTGVERSELALLVRELESAEVAYLGPATERMREERQRLDAQNRALEALVQRREALAGHLRELTSKLDDLQSAEP